MEETGFLAAGEDIVSLMMDNLKIDGKPFYLNGKPAGYICEKPKQDINSGNIWE